MARFLLVGAAMMGRGYWLGCVWVAGGLSVAGCESAEVKSKPLPPPPSAWSAPEPVSDAEGESVSEPRAAAHPGGVHLIWLQGTHSEQSVRARHFDTRTSEWGAIEKLGPAHDASIAADAAGNAVVVWHNEADGEGGVGGAGGADGEGGGAGAGTGTRADDQLVWAARYDSDRERWSEPQRLDVGAAGPRVAMQADGNALAVWTHFPGDTRVFAAAMTPDGTWGRPQPIDSTTEVRSDKTDVVLHADGDATAYLEQRVENDDGSWGGQLAAVRYSKAESAWSEPVPVQRAPSGSFDVQLAGNERGDAVLLWSVRSLGSDAPPEIYTAWYDSSGGSWTKPDKLTAIALNNHSFPDWDGVVAVEGDGSTTVACSHFEDHVDRMVALPLDRNHAFGSAEPLASHESVLNPALQALDDGLMAVWWGSERSYEYTMYSKIFRDGSWQATESSDLIREYGTMFRLANVPNVGVLAYWVTLDDIVTSWHR